MSTSKFTFRKQPLTTGLAGVGNPRPDTDIKLGGKWCGTIRAPNWATKDGKWGAGLMVIDEAEENCGWRWVFFAARFNEEPEARAWLNANKAAIEAKWTIRTDDTP